MESGPGKICTDNSIVKCAGGTPCGGYMPARKWCKHFVCCHNAGSIASSASLSTETSSEESSEENTSGIIVKFLCQPLT